MNLSKLKLSLLAGLVAGAAGAIGVSTFGIAQNAGQTLTSLLSTDLVQVYRGTTAAITYATPDTISNYARGTQLLYTLTGSAASSATTVEQTLGSYSLPANTLNTGTKLRIGASFSGGATNNSKTYKCYFGASAISSSLLTTTTNAKNGSCEMIVTRVSASVHVVYANMLNDVVPITGYVTQNTDADSSAITIKFTATQGASTAGDVIINDFWVERLGN